MGRSGISLGINGDCPVAETSGSVHNPDGDLASVRDEYTVKFSHVHNLRSLFFFIVTGL